MTAAVDVRQLEDAWDAYAELAALEEWNRRHPRRRDPLDNVDDCGGAYCPGVGFSSPEDARHHDTRWARLDELRRTWHPSPYMRRTP